MSDSARGWLFVAAQAALLAVLILAPSGEDWVVSGWMRAVGNLGRLGGAAFIVVGGVRLGIGASVHPEPTTRAVLRTTGPYRFARHPIYSGVLALAAAIALTSGAWTHVAAFVALVVVLAVKARFEERLLVRRFEEYATYAARTGRFVPGIGFGVSSTVEPGT